MSLKTEEYINKPIKKSGEHNKDGMMIVSIVYY